MRHRLRRSLAAPRLLGLLALGALCLAALPSARAQTRVNDVPHVQAGLAAVPGLGTQIGFVSPRSFYTVGGMLYVDASPSFAGGEGTVQLSGGIGGAIRILGLLRVLGDPGYLERDIDVGIRVGPSLFFAVGESSRDENPFSLFLDPFVRATSSLSGNRLFFAELGIQRPLLRAGLLVRL